MDCNDLSESVIADNDNDKDDDDIQFIGETISSKNRSHPEQSRGTGDHEPTSAITAKFQCQICKESLASFAYLHTHLKNAHNATIKLTCNLCGKTFNENRKLIAHVEDHKTKRSNFSETKSKSKRKKSVSSSKPKSKHAKRPRKNKNKTEKSTSFTKRKRQRGATSKEQAKKSKIDEAAEITSVSAVDSDKTNDGSIDTPSTEISIQNAMSPPPPSPSPVSPPQNPTGVDDWGWDTDPQLPQPELSTTLELQPRPDSSSLSVPVITTSPKSSPDADLPENSVFEDYFEPLSPKLEVFDDCDGESDVFNSADTSSIPSASAENRSTFPFQCSKCDLQFQTSDLLKIHQSFHNLLVNVKFRCEVPSCFRYLDDAMEYQTHFTSSHTNKSQSRCLSSRKRKRKRPFNIRRQATIPCKYCSKKSRSKSEAVAHEATHSQEQLKGLKTPNAKAVQSYTKLCFVDEESEFEDPAEDPLMLIESIPESESDTEPETIETNTDPGPGHNHNQDAGDSYSDSLDVELYPNSVEESTIDEEHFGTTQTPTPAPVEPPRNELSPHLVDAVSKIMNFNCVKCNKTFLTQEELDAHTKILRRAQMLSCPKMLCSHRFTTNCSLQVHLKSRHVAAVKGTVNLNAENIKRLTISPQKKELSSLNQESSFSCPKCPARVFSTRLCLLKHLANHKEIPRHVCSVCGKDFKYHELRERHMKTHTANKIFTCPVADCSMPFTTAREQRKHTQRHGRDLPPDNKPKLMPKPLEAPKKGACSFCSSQFDTESELAEHKAAHHTGSHPFPCPKCHKKYTGLAPLRRHLKEVHATVKPFSCPFCDIKFAVNNYLQRHLECHHTHLCPMCGKAHQCKASLEEHMETHSSDPKGFCSFCSSQFDTESELAEHKAAHHTKSRSFPCPKCDKRFTYNRSLGVHLTEVHATDKPFSCPLCLDKHFPSKQRLKKHLLSHPEHNPHRCPTCGKPHLTKTRLDEHIQTHSSDPQEFLCPVPSCSKAYGTPSHLRRHIRGSHAAQKPGAGNETGKEVDIPPTYKCQVCKRDFFTELKFLKHQQVHPFKGNSSQPKFACERCDVTFNTHLGWVRHKIKHDSNTDNLCNVCGRLFPTPEALDAHKKISHKHWKDPQAKEERIVCDVCGKSVDRRQLKVHMNRHSEVPLICDVCGKPCKTEGDLRVHKNTHLSEKPLKCKFCPYRYNHPTSIYSHMRFHHTGPVGSGFVESPLTADLERNFHCDANRCSQSFTSLPCLKQHQLYHTGDKVSRCKICGEKFVAKWEVYIHKQQVHKKSLECEYCKKICVNAQMLKSHIRYNHTLEEPFPCTAPDCDRKFKGKSDLKYHMVVAHTGEYKFECEVCGKKFPTRGNYNTHMRVHTVTKDFRCEEEGCEASFKAASLLHKHLLKDHGRTDLPAAFSRHGKRIQPMSIS